jgi:hypothetical protein
MGNIFSYGGHKSNLLLKKSFSQGKEIFCFYWLESLGRVSCWELIMLLEWRQAGKCRGQTASTPAATNCS